MKEYPILYQPDMVRAKMEGRKNQTRRLTGLKDINQEPDKWRYEDSYVNESGDLIDIFHHLPTNMFTRLKCPYGASGSILWTRETFCKGIVWDGEGPEPGYFDIIGEPRPDHLRPKYFYMADKHDFQWCREDLDEDDPRYFTAKWKPSIHMPKDACRIYSQNTGVRIQRLQDISEEDAKAEGVQLGYGLSTEPCGMSFKAGFRDIIKRINGPEIWDLNPWVRAISFRVLSTTGRPENLEELCTAL